MDYLKYRGCQVDMVQRYVPQYQPMITLVNKNERNLSQCREEEFEEEQTRTPPRQQAHEIKPEYKKALTGERRPRNQRGSQLGQQKFKAVMARNQNQNFSITNYGLGEKFGVTETQEESAKVLKLKG